MAASASDRTAPPTRRRDELRRFGELFALSGLAITQPVLDVFGRSPDHLIFRGVEGRNVVLFGLVVTLLVPAAAYGIEVLVGLVSVAVRHQVHQLALGVLAVILFTILTGNVLTSEAALIAGLALGSVFLVLYDRTRGVRIWLGFLAPAPIVFLLVFLFASPVAPLVRGTAAGGAGSVGRPAPTVILLLDEFPLVTLLDEDGDVDADLFPNFARLAEASHWYRQATTVSNSTTVAVPSMLTGRLPDQYASPSAVEFPDNLFTLVGSSMPVTTSEIITRMCPTAVCERVDADTGGLRALLGDAGDIMVRRVSPTADERDPMSQLVEASVTDRVRPDGAGELWSRSNDGGSERFRRFLDSVTGADELGFVHLLLPHGPYRLLPDGSVYPWLDPGLGRSFDLWTKDPEPVTVARQQFLLQLQWTDRLVGELIDHLEDIDAWDRVNLVVLADHGNGFEPGGTFRARQIREGEDERTIAELLWVPFFVKEAGQTAGSVSDDPVRIVDLLPTIADLLQIDVPWDHDGRSALEGGSGDPDEVGLFRARGGELHGDESYRGFDRHRLHDLLMDRTTGAFAPAGDGVTGTDRIHRVGPRPDLWSEPVPAGARQLEIRLAEESVADDVDIASGSIPALLRAEVVGAPAGSDVAIAVNGTIRATATTYGNPVSIAAMLPVEAFRDGANDITVHLVD